jgi:anti-sigma factor RsiW
MHCQQIKTYLPDLLFEDAAFIATPLGARVQQHLATCPACQAELDGLRSTMNLLDQWSAPEPTPYFDTRMAVRLREQIAAPPDSLWQRILARWQWSSNHSLHAMALRPMVAGALSLAIVIGGATYAGVTFFEQPQPAPQTSATVRDLESMDRNAQTLQQLDTLDQDLNQDAAQAQ